MTRADHDKRTNPAAPDNAVCMSGHDEARNCDDRCHLRGLIWQLTQAGNEFVDKVEDGPHGWGCPCNACVMHYEEWADRLIAWRALTGRATDA